MTKTTKAALIAVLFSLPLIAFAAQKPSFSKADANGNGKVSIQEAVKAGVPKDQAKQADIDNDGKLTKTDWKFVNMGKKQG